MYRMNGLRVDGTYRDRDYIKILLWIGFCVAVIYFSFQLGQRRVATHYSSSRHQIGGNMSRNINFNLPHWLKVDLDDSYLLLADLYLTGKTPVIIPSLLA